MTEINLKCRITVKLSLGRTNQKKDEIILECYDCNISYDFNFKNFLEDIRNDYTGKDSFVTMIEILSIAGFKEINCRF